MLQKKILISAIFAGITTLTVSLGANAALPGFYLGGDLGWGDTGYNQLIGGNGVSVHDTGLAGGGNFGYQLNNNFGVEAGYTQFHTTDVDANNILPGVNLDTHINQYAIDLVGKGILPLQNGFALFGKAGAAYVNGNMSDGKVITNNCVYSVGDNDVHDIYPTASAGISYDITPNLPIDVEYTRIQRVDGGAIASTNYVGAGLTYHFG